MVARQGACACGNLVLDTTGDPARVTVCHCRDCQRRTGNVFGVQASFELSQIHVTGEAKTFVRTGDEGSRITFHFCPDCGSTVYYEFEGSSRVGVPVGIFADESFPAPSVSIYGDRMHPWVSMPASIEIYD